MSIQDIVIKIKGVMGEERMATIRSFLHYILYFVNMLAVFALGWYSSKLALVTKPTEQVSKPIEIVYPDYLPLTSCYTDQKKVAESLGTPVQGSQTQTKTTNTNTSTTTFASKSGKVYYTGNCKAGNRIKTENRVYFNSPKEAASRGYTLAKTCAL